MAMRRLRLLSVLLTTTSLLIFSPNDVLAQESDDRSGGRASAEDLEAARTFEDETPQPLRYPAGRAATAEACPSPAPNSTTLCMERLATPPDLPAPIEPGGPSVLDRQLVPSWCLDHINDGWWVTRFEACEVSSQWVLRSRTCDSSGNCTINGELFFSTYAYAYMESSTSQWAYQLEYLIRSGTGNLAAGAELHAAPGASGNCDVDDWSFPVQSAPVGSDPWGEAFISDPTLAGGGRTACEGQWGWFWITPNGTSNTASINTPTIRCDQDLPGYSSTGCVVRGYRPTLTYGGSSYPEFTGHVRSAQGSGLPGAPGGTPLTRLTGSDVDRNRSTACPSRYPRPSGHQCDEYPFASTDQGAYTGGGDPRTWPGCEITLPGPGSTGPTGYSVCMIDATQNRIAGVRLSSFYYTYRVLDGDAFFVNPSG